MSGIFLGGAPSIASTTVSPAWGTDSVVHPTSKSSTNTGTLTNKGSTGGVDVTFTNTAGGTVQYNLNSAGLLTLTSGTNFTGATGDTWLWRLNAPSAAGTLTITMTDHQTGVVVGTWVLTVT